MLAWKGVKSTLSWYALWLTTGEVMDFIYVSLILLVKESHIFTTVQLLVCLDLKRSRNLYLEFASLRSWKKVHIHGNVKNMAELVI